MTKTLFIVNPAAFGGGARKRWENFLPRLFDNIANPEIIYTQFSGHATQIVKENHDYATIIAVGGDGTVREVVTGIMQLKLPRPSLGILPIGSGNDFARNLGIATPKDGFDAFLNGNLNRVDVFQLNCMKNGAKIQNFGCVLGNIGFGATVIAKQFPIFKRLLGSKLFYYVSTIIPIFTFGKRKMKIESKMFDFEGDCWMLIASNNEWAGAGGMRIAPGAKPHDGKLHMTLVPGMSKLKLFRYLTHLKAGTHINLKGLRFFAAEKIEVISAPIAIVEMDGDPIGTTPAQIQIHSSALSVFMP